MSGQVEEWPYGVIMDLAFYLQEQGHHRTSEQLLDAAHVFAEEALARAEAPDRPAVVLRVVQGGKS